MSATATDFLNTLYPVKEMVYRVKFFEAWDTQRNNEQFIDFLNLDDAQEFRGKYKPNSTLEPVARVTYNTSNPKHNVRADWFSPMELPPQVEVPLLVKVLKGAGDDARYETIIAFYEDGDKCESESAWIWATDEYLDGVNEDMKIKKGWYEYHHYNDGLEESINLVTDSVIGWLPLPR